MASLSELDKVKEPLINEKNHDSPPSSKKQSKKHFLQKWAWKFKRVIMNAKQKMTLKIKLPKQPKITIHFVRAAECSEDAQHDPSIRRTGFLQAHCLAKQFSDMDKVTHIICSPMRRAVETAVIGFAPAVARGVDIVAIEALRDRKSAGTSLSNLKSEFVHSHVDLSLMGDGWEKPLSDKYGDVEMSIHAVDYIFAHTLLSAKAPIIQGSNVEHANMQPRDIHLVVITHGSVLGVTGESGLCNLLKLGKRYLDRKDDPDYAPCHRFYHTQYRSIKLWTRMSEELRGPCVAWRETTQSWNRVWMLVGRNLLGCCRKNPVMPSICPGFWGHVRNLFPTGKPKAERNCLKKEEGRKRLFEGQERLRCTV